MCLVDIKTWCNLSHIIFIRWVLPCDRYLRLIRRRYNRWLERTDLPSNVNGRLVRINLGFSGNNELPDFLGVLFTLVAHESLVGRVLLLVLDKTWSHIIKICRSLLEKSRLLFSFSNEFCFPFTTWVKFIQNCLQAFVETFIWIIVFVKFSFVNPLSYVIIALLLPTRTLG